MGNAALKLVAKPERRLPEQKFKTGFDDFPELRSDPYAKDILIRFFEGGRSGERMRPNGIAEVTYKIDGDELLRLSKYKPYKSCVDDDRVLVRHVLARRFNGIIVGNSSVLGRASGDDKGGMTLQVQIALGRHVPMVPYKVLRDNDLDINKLEILDFGGSEYFKIEEEFRDHLDGKWKKRVVNRHFGGSCLFRVEKQVYLFDVDRQEIEHKIFNPFVSKLNDVSRCETIKDAYISLKPHEVRVAESIGIKCPRHGEWFFIPKFKRTRSLKKFEKGHLHNGKNMSHDVQHWNEAYGVVTGRVEHWLGRMEHEPLELDKNMWYQAIPNTATESFTIRGRVD